MDNNRKSLFDFDEHEEQLKKGLSSKLSKRITSKIAAKPSKDLKDSRDFGKDSKEEFEKFNAKDYSKDSSTIRDPSKRNVAESSKINNFVITNARPNYEVLFDIYISFSMFLLGKCTN